MSPQPETCSDKVLTTRKKKLRQMRRLRRIFLAASFPARGDDPFAFESSKLGNLSHRQFDGLVERIRTFAQPWAFTSTDEALRILKSANPSEKLIHLRSNQSRREMFNHSMREFPKAQKRIRHRMRPQQFSSKKSSECIAALILSKEPYMSYLTPDLLQRFESPGPVYFIPEAKSKDDTPCCFRNIHLFAFSAFSGVQSWPFGTFLNEEDISLIRYCRGDLDARIKSKFNINILPSTMLPKQRDSPKRVLSSTPISPAAIISFSLSDGDAMLTMRQRSIQMGEAQERIARIADCYWTLQSTGSSTDGIEDATLRVPNRKICWV